jgi:hypothetical protein
MRKSGEKKTDTGQGETGSEPQHQKNTRESKAEW